MAPRWRTAMPAAVALAGALVTSCREATGPLLRVSVVVASVQGPTYSADSTGRQVVECDLTLQARDDGSRRAAWMDAAFAFYSPNDSTKPFAIDTVPAATVRRSWGADSIGPDSTRTARWHLAADVPFALKIRFRFQMAGGPPDSAGVSVSCEPHLAAGPPPTITRLASLQYAYLEPGRTLTLFFDARSTIGLWQSVLRMTGPCDTTLLFPEQLRTTTYHAVGIVLPAACSLGVPIAVTGVAFDARLQGTGQTITLPGLVDSTPPVLTVLMTPPNGGGWPAARLAGDVFVGDSIRLQLGATDNHDIHVFHWEILPQGYRDSLLVSGASASGSVAIPVQSGWVGPIQLRVDAVDGSGNASAPTLSAADSIHVAPVDAVSPAATTVAGETSDLTFDAARNVVYLLQPGYDRIQVLSLASRSLTGTIALPALPRGIDLTASGDTLVTAFVNTDSLGLVDLLRSPPGLTTLPLTGVATNNAITNVRVTRTGKVLLPTIDFSAHTDRIYTYDLATDSARLRIESAMTDYWALGYMNTSFDGSVVVANGGTGEFLRYDVPTDTFEAAVSSLWPLTFPWVDSTGSHVAVGGDIYDAGLRYVRHMRAAPSPSVAYCMSPDGQTLFISYGTLGVVRSRVADGSTIDRIPSSVRPDLLRVSPDGRTLVVVQSGSGTTQIGVLDLRQLP